MALPKATPSTTKTPGFYLQINLAAGTNNAGNASLKALMIAWASSAGDIDVETEVRRCYGPDDVERALGINTPGHLAAVEMFATYGALILDVVACAAPSGTDATGTFTASGTPTDTNYFQFDVAGRKIGPVPWAAGESTTVFTTRAINAINGKRRIPVDATSGGAAITTVTAVTDGTWGNDITIGVTKVSGTGGTVTASGTKLTTGAGEIDITIALGLVDTEEYAAIGLVTGNTDAEDASSTSNAELLMASIEENLSGGAALLQYGYVASTTTVALAKQGAIGRNSKNLTHVFARNAQSLPAELMGFELADSMRWYAVRANYNRIGNTSPRLVGSKSKTIDKLSLPESEDLLSNGVTPYDFAPNSDQLRCVCPITTYSFLGSSPDYRCFYQSDVWGQFAFARDLRAALPAEFPNCSITQDLPAGTDSLPDRVVERRDVEAFCWSRARSFATAGILDATQLEGAITDGTFAIEIDEDDESQVNIFIPDKIVKPLAKFSVVINKL